MFALLLTTVLAADQGPVAVVIASKRAGAEAFTPKVAAKVHATFLTNSTAQPIDDTTANKTLKKAGIDAKACQGAPECLQKAALALGPKAIVIGVDVGKIAKTLAIHLEAVSAESKEPLAVADFSANADTWAEQSVEPITAFAKQVIEKLKTPAAAQAKNDIKPMPADAPQDTALTPPPTPAPSPAVTATRSGSSGGAKILPVIGLGFAAAALITSGVMLGLGMTEKGAVDRSLGNGGTTTELSKAEYDARVSRGNLYFTISLSTALVGLVLGAASGVLFAVN